MSSSQTASSGHPSFPTAMLDALFSQMEDHKITKKTENKLKNTAIVHEGTQIVLPVINGKPLSYDEAILWLKRKKDEDEQEFAVNYEIHASPLDGAVAFQRAIAAKYGWSQGVPTPGFFGDKPPVMIGVPVGAGERINVPWGRIEIPGIEGHLTTGMAPMPHPHFIVGGTVKKKHAENVKELVALTEKFLKEESIYKGKAIRVSFDYIDEDGDVEFYDPIQHAPQFLELDGVTDNDLIFGEEVMAAINTGLFTPIEHAGACRKYGVPLKRGVLLHGPYGTGKTLTAYVSAVKAVRHGWTFIYLSDVSDLRAALRFAAQYAPAVLFAEDIDRAVTGDRSTDMDAILNTLDGVDTKGAEIITVLTTNHIEDINPAMLRPGRLDTLVEVLPPDAKAAERLVSLYGRGLLEEGIDLKKIGKALNGNIPAFIREVTERSKIAAIARLGNDIEGQVLESDLLEAAQAMKNHASLLVPKKKSDTPAHKLFVVREDDNSRDAIESLEFLSRAA